VIILDTNVISEPLRPRPAEQVIRWLDAQRPEDLCLTTITLAEVRFGIAALPAGRRRSILSRRFEAETLPWFADRVLTFDEPASQKFAQVQADASARGRTIGAMDGLIAAVCLAHGCDLATRNVKDFAGTGVGLIDPWHSDC